MILFGMGLLMSEHGFGNFVFLKLILVQENVAKKCMWRQTFF
jgi:hypothetical protein